MKYYLLLATTFLFASCSLYLPSSISNHQKTPIPIPAYEDSSAQHFSLGGDIMFSSSTQVDIYSDGLLSVNSNPGLRDQTFLGTSFEFTYSQVHKYYHWGVGGQLAGGINGNGSEIRSYGGLGTRFLVGVQLPGEYKNWRILNYQLGTGFDFGAYNTLREEADDYRYIDAVYADSKATPLNHLLFTEYNSKRWRTGNVYYYKLGVFFEDVFVEGQYKNLNSGISLGLDMDIKKLRIGTSLSFGTHRNNNLILLTSCYRF